VAAAYISTISIAESAPDAPLNAPHPSPLKIAQIPEFSGVFRGRELTRKDRKLTCGIASVDALIGGGIPRGRISEITGRPGSGRTTLAAAFAAQATRRGETAAWIDTGHALDPASLGEAGVDLARMLWASLAGYVPREADSSGGWSYRRRRRSGLSRENLALKAAETVLEAGGFGLVVVDFGERPRAIAPAAALRLARAAERGGAAVIAIAPYRMCGTFAALSVAMRRRRAAFGRIHAGSPATFDGIAIEATVARNKLGGSGASAELAAAIDPAAGALSADSSASANDSERPLPAGCARHPPRIGEGTDQNQDQNYDRVALHSFFTGRSPHSRKDPLQTSPYQGEGSAR
jgi:hypothetical protein